MNLDAAVRLVIDERLIEISRDFEPGYYGTGRVAALWLWYVERIRAEWRK